MKMFKASQKSVNETKKRISELKFSREIYWKLMQQLGRGNPKGHKTASQIANHKQLNM